MNLKEEILRNAYDYQGNYFWENYILSNLVRTVNNEKNKFTDLAEMYALFYGDDIKDIKNNHLHGIYKKLTCIEKKMYQRPGWFLTVLVSILCICLTFILTNYFK